MKKILTILGARPQFIKASAVSNAITKTHLFEEIVVHTGQHFDENMSDIFFSELGMNRPKYELNINGGNHGNMTGRMLIEIEQTLLKEKPDIVLVYGDTNSTLAGALSAAKLHIPVAHVEAGLRSFNMHMPEEINRILTDRISTWLFTPTELANHNLIAEGFPDKKIHMVGDVMYDVALLHGTRVSTDEGIMSQLRLQDKSYILATIHRAENTDNAERLNIIVSALIETSKVLPVVWPLHPRTKIALQKMGLFDSLSQHIKIINPVGYMDMIQLEKFSALIATDSGGVQKEAFFYKVPCVTLRSETEWVELLDGGWNRIAPLNSSIELKDCICEAINSMGEDIIPYGKGNAADEIVSILSESVH